ncbi:hypothetical protein J3Q64DRAFT_1745813 [Phycomyces blakesleeanus]|uniref:Rho-GAP domain-containing protein n=2 Tax=Phycomyces blakesleeanus TaxID=4837 RepID=A0A167P249_PHYB8|nr:hypothetical protein PHYBLDRAFT_180322 [Phycomyces blakesleeanus NRRL 1555(-)]OAD77099.1 hypothetical protein PHYBLDRAFT_180322 [Phycomyces blakesleeanus NRRL 1555(-)]|eukprot:XP_018295139.1 hypothetical protein PHYBLDRAFT_180322 [Phycomyces blakesleeanus NRRL 1555(-)]
MMRKNSPTPNSKAPILTPVPADMQLEKIVQAPLVMIDAAMRESSQDLNRWIDFLKRRVKLEERYHKELAKISQDVITDKSITQTNQPTKTKTMFTQFVEMSETLHSHRTNLTISMRNQIDILSQLRTQQDRQKMQHRRNMFGLKDQYLKTRLEELPLAHDTYMQKCEELEKSQETSTNMTLSPTTMTPTSPLGLGSSLARPSRSGTSMTLPTSIASDDTESGYRMLSLDEDRPLPSGSSVSSASSISPRLDIPASPSPHRRIERFMKQFSNLTHHNDLGRQNVRSAKLKVEVVEADHEYRKIVRKLDTLDKTRVAANDYAVKLFRTHSLESAKHIKEMVDIVLAAQLAYTKSSHQIVRNAHEIGTNMEPEDVLNECDKILDITNIVKPQSVYYINRRVGLCKDLIFGISLVEYAQIKGRAPPLIVTKCINAVETLGGLEREGIYRMSGKKSNVELIKQSFERDEEATVFGQDDVPEEVFSIASVLKIFLRELETPLFPFKLADRITYSQTEKELRLMNLLTRLLKLPFGNYETLKVLIEHLSRLTKSVDKNKMSINNLSLIFTPAIFQDHNQAQRSPGDWFSDCVLEDLIQNHESLFGNKDLHNASSITGGIEYGFEHIHDQDLDSCDFSLPSPSSSVFDYSPTESIKSLKKVSSTGGDSQTSLHTDQTADGISVTQYPQDLESNLLAEQSQKVRKGSVDSFVSKQLGILTGRPERSSSRPPSPASVPAAGPTGDISATVNPATPIPILPPSRQGSLDKLKKYRAVSQDRGLKVNTRISNGINVSDVSILNPNNHVLSPSPVQEKNLRPLVTRESGLKSATIPSYDWLNRDPEVGPTPVPRLYRSTTTGKKTGPKRKLSIPANPISFGKSL